MKISAVIITFNEERNIERCLCSLQGVVDEIVVLDSFSTDRTEEICHEQNVRFFQQTWKGYGSQKNDANMLASHPVILSIDADEALSTELQQAILKIKNESDLESTIYEMSRLTNYCGRWIYHCGWYPDTKVRLFDKRFVSWNNKQVHEGLIYTKNMHIERLQGNLLHYSFYSIGEHINTINKYTDLAAQEAFSQEKKRNIFHIIMSAFWRFMRDYFFKKGFKDGFYGLIICSLNAFSIFLRYSKLKHLYVQQNKTSAP